MAKKDKSILKSYFETGDYPTESQFSDALDSYVHKDERIETAQLPPTVVNALNAKAEQVALQAVETRVGGVERTITEQSSRIDEVEQQTSGLGDLEQRVSKNEDDISACGNEIGELQDRCHDLEQNKVQDISLVPAEDKATKYPSVAAVEAAMTAAHAALRRVDYASGNRALAIFDTAAGIRNDKTYADTWVGVCKVTSGDTVTWDAEMVTRITASGNSAAGRVFIETSALYVSGIGGFASRASGNPLPTNKSLQQVISELVAASQGGSAPALIALKTLATATVNASVEQTLAYDSAAIVTSGAFHGGCVDTATGDITAPRDGVAKVDGRVSVTAGGGTSSTRQVLIYKNSSLMASAQTYFYSSGKTSDIAFSATFNVQANDIVRVKVFTASNTVTALADGDVRVEII